MREGLGEIEQLFEVISPLHAVEARWRGRDELQFGPKGNEQSAEAGGVRGSTWQPNSIGRGTNSARPP